MNVAQYKWLLSTFYVNNKFRANFMFHKLLLENEIFLAKPYFSRWWRHFHEFPSKKEKKIKRP